MSAWLFSPLTAMPLPDPIVAARRSGQGGLAHFFGSCPSPGPRAGARVFSSSVPVVTASLGHPCRSERKTFGRPPACLFNQKNLVRFSLGFCICHQQFQQLVVRGKAGLSAPVPGVVGEDTRKTALIVPIQSPELRREKSRFLRFPLRLALNISQGEEGHFSNA